MSRIGKQPIKVPEKVKVSVTGSLIKAEGPLGRLELLLDPQVSLGLENGVIRLKNLQETPEAHCRQGLMRNLVRNMVEGVSQGYKKVLEINGVGYRAEVKGSQLGLSLGFSHPVEFKIPDGIKIQVEKQVRLTVSGCSKGLVGETTARIRRLRPPEPYKGKGIKYEGEVIRRKVGKAAVSGGAK